MNPFGAAAREEAEARRARAPCIVDDLPNLIGPVSQFAPAKRELAENMIADGVWDCVKRGDEFYVSDSDFVHYTVD